MVVDALKTVANFLYNITNTYSIKCRNQLTNNKVIYYKY
jgi:hypothetical protein